MAAALFLVACDDKGSDPGKDPNDPGRAPMKVDAGNPSDCNPSGDLLIEVTSPAATQKILVPGDTLVLRWRSLVSDFQGYIPLVSLDDGATWEELSAGSVLPEASPEAQCFDFTILIPEDGSYTPEDKDNTGVMFRVKDYSNTKPAMRAESARLTVVAP